MVSEARQEKNFQNAKEDHQALKAQKLKDRRIKFLQSEIEKNKQAIIECMELDWFSAAANHVQRVQDLKVKIQKLTQN